MIRKVISGGQTGADQAGLMAAFRCGISTGGTAPENWHTENGPNLLLSLLGLQAQGTLRSRTIKNVKDSDGTVLLTMTSGSPGSVLTRNEAGRQGKPFKEIDLRPIVAAMLSGDTEGTLATLVLEASRDIQAWVLEHAVAVLNVAGNREKSPLFLTTKAVETILTNVFQTLKLTQDSSAR